MITKSLFFGATFAGVLLISACASPVDIPIPNDPQAQEWSPGIQVAYPDWQQPTAMPMENPDYADSLIAAAQAAKEVPVAAETKPVKKVEPEKNAVQNNVSEDKTVSTPEPVTPEVKQEPVEKPVSPEEKEPAKPLTPDFTRIDILFPAGQTEETYSLNGEVISLNDLKVQLKKFAEDCGDRESTALIYIANPDAVNSQKIMDIIKICKDSGITRSSVVDARDLSGVIVTQPDSTQKVNAAPVEKPQRFKIAVDPEKTAEEYEVQPGESLSVIAKKMYKDGNLWHILYENNKDVIKDKNYLRAGTKIKIPALRKVVAE